MGRAMKGTIAKLLALLLVLGGFSGCCKPFGDCPDPNPAAPSECWSAASVSHRLSCKQPDAEAEPNNTVPLAHRIAAPGCTSTPVEGVLAGDDVDAFHAHGERCDAKNPALHLGTEGVRACLFVQCSTGNTGTVVDRKSGGDPQLCDDGSMAVHHPNGLLGCCLSKPGDVTLDVDCSTVRKTLDAFVIVDGNVKECTPYDVAFHL